MLYSVSELKKDIRIVLDQNMTSEQLFESGDIDTLSLEEIIESKIVDAARLVETNAPLYLIDGGKQFNGSIDWDSAHGYGSGRILLPDDFMRLVSFMMSDWDYPVSAALTEDDPEYAMQRSRYPGIKGNPQRPIVAITTHPAGQVLEFYSGTAGESVYVRRAQYLPMPEIKDDMIDLCVKLRRSIVYRAASLVATAIGQADLAAALLNTCNELMS